MTKKGPLSKAEMFYIQHHYQNSDAEALSKELDRARSLVESHITKCRKEDVDNKPFNASNQFAYKKGTTIMTENASVLADEIKKKKAKSGRSNCVTKIK
jgi:hypothetical protein